MMAKELTTAKIGRNDHVFTWERTRKTTFRGAKRDISKALRVYLQEKIGDPLASHVLIEFNGEGISVTESDSVALHSATE